jgi:hypothetical protein
MARFRAGWSLALIGNALARNEGSRQELCGAFSIRRPEGSRQGGGRGLWRFKGDLVPKHRGQSAAELRAVRAQAWSRERDGVPKALGKGS